MAAGEIGLFHKFPKQRVMSKIMPWCLRDFSNPPNPQSNVLTKSTLFAVKRLRGVYNSSNPFIANRGGGERGLADSKLPRSRKVLQNILQNFVQSAHPHLRPIVLTNIKQENK